MPKPGEIWLICVMSCCCDEVFVQMKSRFFSWLFGAPHYWVTSRGGRISWLEAGEEFLWPKYPAKAVEV